MSDYVFHMNTVDRNGIAVLHCTVEQGERRIGFQVERWKALHDPEAFVELLNELLDKAGVPAFSRYRGKVIADLKATLGLP